MSIENDIKHLQNAKEWILDKLKGIEERRAKDREMLERLAKNLLSHTHDTHAYVGSTVLDDEKRTGDREGKCHGIYCSACGNKVASTYGQFIDRWYGVERDKQGDHPNIVSDPDVTWKRED